MSDPVDVAPGYGVVTKLLHWLTVLALLAQFVVGYSMERADDEDGLLLIHAALGISILVITVIRLLWRTATSLPPWAEGLSAFERQLEHRLEQLLYLLLFVIPLTGLALVLGSGEDWEIGDREWDAPWELADDDVLLTAHITTHIVFFVVLALHVGLVLKHQLIDRDRLLRRML